MSGKDAPHLSAGKVTTQGVETPPLTAGSEKDAGVKPEGGKVEVEKVASDAELPPVARMTEPRVEKIVVNIGVGEAGEKLAKAEKVLEMVTHQRPLRTISKTTNKDLGLRWGMPIGCKVTIRKKAAEEFLKTALWVKENRITSYSFDPEGNFSFGITDYTDFPGQKYNPEIGIFGMDVCVVLSRPGRRISLRTRARRRIPHGHRLTRQDALDWIKRKFKVEVVD
jgi:large subunit ribosomal protein L5